MDKTVVLNANTTEVFPSSNNETQILDNNSTQVLDSNTFENVTRVLGVENYVPLEMSVGSEISGYKITEILAENTGEATILKAQKEEDCYVLKIYHKGKKPKDELLKIINSIQSPNIIRPLETFLYNERVCEVLPFFQQGDLLKNLPLSADCIEQIIIPGINNALHTLHSNMIIHRDIKPSNIFLTDDLKSVVVGDFGISSVLQSDVSVRVTNRSKTLGYAAPETYSGFVSKESDYYSFGITLLYLFMGVDPFEGMGDAQILFQAINKKLEIPIKVPQRVRQLIQGLTIKDRTNRWGYQQVLEWIEGKNPEIKEIRKRKADFKPYRFNKEEYYDLESLSMAFAQDWNTTKKHLFRGLIEKHVAQYGEDYVSDCIDCKNIKNQDVAVFELLYVINPGAPLCFRGKVYNDLTYLSREMFTNGDELVLDIMDLIKTGCLQEFVERNQFDSNIQDIVKECTSMIVAGEDQYYYALMYALDDQIGYSYDSLLFNTLEDFIEYIQNLEESDLSYVMQDVLDDDKFPMWLYAKGFREQVNEWLNIYKNLEW